MPDPLRQTVSATEVSALFDANPYQTRWMLYRRFALGEESFTPEDNRMGWGKKMEPLLIKQAAEDLKFIVEPNVGPDGKQIYVRNGLIGCTRDARIYCPDRGWGVLETKCVFDYRTWMAEWSGGNKVPKHNEIQVQIQMKAGDGESKPGAGDAIPYTWGVFAVWIAGDIQYFERKPIPKLWKAIDTETARFFADVKKKNEPDPFGAMVEFPLMNEVWPVGSNSVLDLREDPAAMEIAEACRQFQYHATQRLSHEKAEKAMKARFRGVAKDCERVLLPNGISIDVKQSPRAGYTVKPTTTTTVSVHVPDDLRGGELTPFEGVELGA